jgi:hypothetical protein
MLRMSTAAKEKITDQDRAEAAGLLKLKAARDAVADAAKTLEAERGKFAALEAERADLPLDDGRIQQHLVNEQTARTRIAIAEKRAAAAEATLATLQDEAGRAERIAAYDRVAEQGKRLAARFDEEFPRHAAALFDLFVQASNHADDCARVNRALPDGAAPVATALKFLPGGPPTRVVIEAQDGMDHRIWGADQFGDSTTDVYPGVR